MHKTRLGTLSQSRHSQENYHFCHFPTKILTWAAAAACDVTKWSRVRLRSFSFPLLEAKAYNGFGAQIRTRALAWPKQRSHHQWVCFFEAAEHWTQSHVPIRHKFGLALDVYALASNTKSFCKLKLFYAVTCKHFGCKACLSTVMVSLLYIMYNTCTCVLSFFMLVACASSASLHQQA